MGQQWRGERERRSGWPWPWIGGGRPSDKERHRGQRRACRFETLEPRWVLDGHLAITELVASNRYGLRDEQGDRPDWLEIYNAAATPADLTGWYLTDDPDELDKWTLPSLSLAPHDYLVVFASGKDRTDPAAPLHTNFKLDADGEYAALVQPDGTTIASEVSFPRQHPDTSFGFPQSATTTRVIEPTSAARFFIPTRANGGAEFGDTWLEPEFDDADWSPGSASIGFDLFGAFDQPPVTDIQEEMFQVNPSAYLRIPFTLEDPTDVSSLELLLTFDDAYVVYLNGTEVGRWNVPPFLSPFSSSAGTFERPQAHRRDLFEFRDQLLPGENILAIQGLNSSVGQGDFLMSVSLSVSSAGDVASDRPGYFPVPTPGILNADMTYRGELIGDLSASVPHGFYDAPFEVLLSTPTPGATIVYTTDGSLPTLEHGTPVRSEAPGDRSTATLTVSATTTLRARAYRDNALPSSVLTQTYVFLDDVLSPAPDDYVPPGWPAEPVNGQLFSFGMDPDVLNNPEFGPLLKDAMLDIPSISLVTEQANLTDPLQGVFVNAELSRENSRKWERPVSVELIDPDGSQGFTIDAGLRIRGGASRRFDNAKHAFRLFFRGEYGEPKLRYPLFGDEGVDSFDKIDLRTAQAPSWSWCEVGNPQWGCRFNTMVREVFSRDTQRDLGQPYTRSRYYHLYLNGQYWGLFQTQERAEASFAESYFGGDASDYDVIKHDRNILANEATDGNMEAWRQLWEIAKEGFESDEAYYRVQGLNTDGTRNPDYPVLLDVDNLIDYVQIIFFTGDLDAAISNFLGNTKANNWYGIRNRNGEEGFRFFIHDAEWTLRRLRENRLGPWPAGDTFDQSNPQWLHQQLMANAEYRLRFADHVEKQFFNGGAFTPGATRARLRERINQIDLAIIAESARWGDWNAVDQLFTKEDWLKEIRYILDDYLPYRTEIVVEQFKHAVGPDGQTPAPLYPDTPPPLLSQRGGNVPFGYPLSFDGPDEIYYTLDGTDPRPGNPGAVRYTAPVTLTKPVVVKARSRVEAEWSALVEATFHVTSPLKKGVQEARFWITTRIPRESLGFHSGLLGEAQDHRVLGAGRAAAADDANGSARTDR